MKKYSYVFLLILVCEFAFANVAMPGFWNVGGNGEFVPLFQKDLVHLGKVQMQSESIKILIYKGFAIVKGEYNMLNLTDSVVDMQVAYPINSAYFDKDIFSVHFQDLENLQIWIDGKQTQSKLLNDKDQEKANIHTPKHLRSTPSNWYVWQMRFAAKSITKITVYYMLNTNYATMKSGYNSEPNNGFAYILESGKAWAKNIEEGKILIQLKDGLKLKDILGIKPFNQFKANAQTQQLLYDFKNLEPDSSSNILMRYGEKIADFDYEKIKKDFAKYYQEIDKLSTESLDLSAFQPFKATDFKVHQWFGGFLVGIAFFLLAFGIPILLVVLGLMTLIFYFRKPKKS